MKIKMKRKDREILIQSFREIRKWSNKSLPIRLRMELIGILNKHLKMQTDNIRADIKYSSLEAWRQASNSPIARA